MKRWYEREAALGLALLAAAAALVWLPPLVPVQDYWNHVASAYVADRLLSGDAALSANYWLVWRPVPNLVTELVLMALVKAFPPDVAGRFVLSLLVLAGAGAFLMLRAALAKRGQSMHLAWAAPFTLSSFLAFGFFNFALGFSLAVMVISLSVNGIKTPRRFALALVLSTLTYFCHAAAFGLAGLALVLRAVVERDRRELALAAGALLPGAALLVLFLGVPETSPIELSLATIPVAKWWHLPGVKLYGFIGAATGYSFVAGLARLGLVAAVAVALAKAPVRDAAFRWAMWAALALYVVIPFDIGHATFALDWRCLPFALLFLLLSRAPSELTSRRVNKLAVALACVTVFEWASYAAHWSARAPAVEALVDAVPKGARVLPVVGVHSLGRVNPLLHVPARELTRGASYYPYLFAYRYHLVRQRGYPGRLPHSALTTTFNQGGGCEDLASPTGGVGALGAPLVALDKAIECAAWNARGVAGGAGEFPDLAAIAGAFDGVLVLGASPALRARVGALGDTALANEAGEYVTLGARRAAGR